LESDQSESDSVTPHTGTATTDIRDIMDTTRAAITAITGVLHIIVLTTVDPHTTTGEFEVTNTTRIITTAIKRTGWCEG
jgi:hypothetical protein